MIGPQPSLFTRIKNVFFNLIQHTWSSIKNLNIFPLRSFGNDDREIAKRRARYSTRLYLLLLIISFITFGLYTFIRPQLVSQTIENPSMNVYENLLARSSNNPSSIDCSCSTVSITYKSFLQMEPSFHQVS